MLSVLIDTCPPVPKGTIAMLARMSAPTTLRFDVLLHVVPVGKAPAKPPGPDPAIAPIDNTTAEAVPSDGTPRRPSASNSTSPPGRVNGLVLPDSSVVPAAMRVSI